MKRTLATERQTRAKELLDAAAREGSVPSLQGSWVVFKPPLSMDLLLASTDLGDALAQELKLRESAA